MPDLPIIAGALPVLNEEGVHRLRRIETKLTLLCIHMGIDPVNKSRIILVAKDPPFVEISGFDVSYGDVLQFLGVQGILSGVVTVLCGGRLVGSIAVELPTITTEKSKGAEDGRTTD